MGQDLHRPAGKQPVRLAWRQLELARGSLGEIDDPVAAEDFVLAAKLLSRQHLILAVMIAPLAVQPLFSEGKIEDPDELYRKLAGHLSWVKLQNLQRLLARKGVQFHVVSNQQLGLRLVSYYMDLKRRQAL